MRINWQSIGRTNVYNVICADQYFWQLTLILLRLSSWQIQTSSTRVNPGFYFTAFSIDGTMSGNQKTTMRYSIFLNYLNIWKWIFLRLKNGLHSQFFFDKMLLVSYFIISNLILFSKQFEMRGKRFNEYSLASIYQIKNMRNKT